jgi:hypothetical protein
VTDIPEEAVTAAAERVVTELRKHMFTAHVGDEFLRGVAFDAAAKALADAAPSLLAAGVSAHRAEQDAVHADLSMLLRVLGMGDHARPQSSHEVMLDAINEVGKLRQSAEAIRADERNRFRRYAKAMSDGSDDLPALYDMAMASGARDERQRLAAVISPEQFRKVAEWFDVDDEFKEAMFPETWSPASRKDDVQQDLRKFADLLDGEPS